MLTFNGTRRPPSFFPPPSRLGQLGILKIYRIPLHPIRIHINQKPSTSIELAALRFALWSGDCDGDVSSPLDKKGSAGNISRPFTTEGRLPNSCAAAVAKLSPAASAASAPCSSWVYDELTLPRNVAAVVASDGSFGGVPSVATAAASPANKCVVRAVIENDVAPQPSPPPPPSSRSSGVWRGDGGMELYSKTPPNTAPLPAKFSRAPVPQNLLRLQRPATTASEIESSSAASNNEISVVEDDDDEPDEEPVSGGKKRDQPQPQRRVCPPAPKPKRSMAIANSLASWKNNNNNTRDNNSDEKRSRDEIFLCCGNRKFLTICIVLNSAKINHICLCAETVSNVTALNFRTRIKSAGAGASSAHSSMTGGRFKLPLALGKHRSRLGKASGGGIGGDGDAESTSSGESTPQKKKSPSSQTPASSLLIKPAGVPMSRPMAATAAAAAAATTVRRGAEITKHGLGRRKKRLFFGGGGNSGGSSCSSAMSSLESIRSNASDGVQGGDSRLLKYFNNIIMYREVQLHSTPEIEVFQMWFEKCHTKTENI